MGGVRAGSAAAWWHEDWCYGFKSRESHTCAGAIAGAHAVYCMDHDVTYLCCESRHAHVVLVVKLTCTAVRILYESDDLIFWDGRENVRKSQRDCRDILYGQSCSDTRTLKIY